MRRMRPTHPSDLAMPEHSMKEQNIHLSKKTKFSSYARSYISITAPHIDHLKLRVLKTVLLIYYVRPERLIRAAFSITSIRNTGP
jgi:hypothetical protein